MGYSTRENFWFGTEQRSGWFRSPMRNYEAPPETYSEGGTLLNGGGYQFDAWGSHKMYQFEWGSATPVEWAQKLKSYSDGTNGRGLIYFHEPVAYTRNVLPARWADPSMALNYEGSGLVYGVDPVPVDTPGGDDNNYPVLSAQYNLDFVASGWRGREDAVFVPIPAGYTLFLGAAYSYTGAGGVFYRESNRGVLGATGRVSPTPLDGTTVAGDFVSASETLSGVWLYVGKSVSGAGSVTLSGMTARLIETEKAFDSFGYGEGDYGDEPYGGFTSFSVALMLGPWIGGMGNSGTRFVGKPTYDFTGPLDGGQVGFAASFREVGDFSW